MDKKLIFETNSRSSFICNCLLIRVSSDKIFFFAKILRLQLSSSSSSTLVFIFLFFCSCPPHLIRPECEYEVFVDFFLPSRFRTHTHTHTLLLSLSLSLTHVLMLQGCHNVDVGACVKVIFINYILARIALTATNATPGDKIQSIWIRFNSLQVQLTLTKNFALLSS